MGPREYDVGRSELRRLDAPIEERSLLVTEPFPFLGTEREDRSILLFHCPLEEQGVQVMGWKWVQDEEIVRLAVLYTWRDLRPHWQAGRGQQTRRSDVL